VKRLNGAVSTKRPVIRTGVREMPEPVRDVEAEMKAAVAACDYKKAGEIGVSVGYSLDFINVVIATIEVELGRVENAKKIWPAL
jgi:hypothetical protein